jgi:uncharacterized protein (TIGR02246 family)
MVGGAQCPSGAAAMRKFVVPFLLMTLGVAAIGAADTDAEHAADKAAINAVLTYRFVAGWNDHDAHVFASAFAEDADFTSDRGVNAVGRYRIEQFHAQVFQKMFSRSHLSTEVKKIRFLKPDVAVVDVRWEMTDSLTADGLPAPYRTGLFDLVFTTSGGPWFITVMHSIDLTPVPAPTLADK